MRSSRLVGPPFAGPEDVVGWHLAMQSQDYAPASWSIGQRSRGLVAADVDAALADGSIVRTHVLRPTWHFVARDDLRWLLALSGPRVHQANASRYRELGLDARTRARCERVIARALDGGERRTRDELAAILDRARIDAVGQRMPYILIHCELEGVIGSGGLEGKRQTYALLDGRVPDGGPFDRDDALVELVRRYLSSHGPATVKDMSWWSGLTMRDLRAGLEALGPGVQDETVDGVTFWALTEEDRDRPQARGVHLLQAYDETIVGYTESRWFGDPRGEAVVTAWRDPGRPSGVLLFGEGIAGLWSRRVDGASIRIGAFLFEPRKRGLVAALGRAADEHSMFFGRPVTLDISPTGG
jgi:hypothetical protein